jgi:tetratricopeptide (TPR) repeat protein
LFFKIVVEFASMNDDLTCFAEHRLADAIDACSAQLDALTSSSSSSSTTLESQLRIQQLRLNRATAFALLDMREHATRDFVAIHTIADPNSSSSSSSSSSIGALGIFRVRARLAHSRLLKEREAALALLNAAALECADFALFDEIRREKARWDVAAVESPPPAPSAQQSAESSVQSVQSAAAAVVVVEEHVVESLERGTPLSDDTEQAAAKIVVQRGLVQHALGDAEADAMIARGYLQVNTGKLAEAIEIFGQLLARKPYAVAAYLGRGTARALAGALPLAERDLSVACRMAPQVADGFKRRAQVRSALGNDDGALTDLATAQRLAPDDWETFFHSGSLYMKRMDHRGALRFFDHVIEAAGAAATALAGSAPGSTGDARRKAARAVILQAKHQAAVARSVIGDVARGAELFGECLAESPSADTLTALATAHREAGQADEAIKCLTTAAQMLDKAGGAKLAFALHLRAQLRFQRGQHRAALRDARLALAADAASVDAESMCGVLLQGVGRYREALAHFDAVHARQPAHVAYYNRAFAALCHSLLDAPFRDVCFDRLLTPLVKESWCKRRDASLSLGREYTRTVALGGTDDVADNASLDGVEDAARIKRLLAQADPLGRRMQYDCAGFVSNERQQRIFGLGMIAIAQELRAVFAAAAGAAQVPKERSSYASETHEFGWRDLYDMGVRWRQIAEPNDPVFWVDALTPEQFAEGFGSHTPMVTKQTHVVRYSPFLQRATDIVRALLLEHGGAMLSAAERAAVAEARDYRALVRAMGRDFWVVTRCESRARPGAVMEGTRLTMQLLDAQLQTYEVSIRTPGTPQRWEQFDAEMRHHFAELCRAARANETGAAVAAAHRLAFYWYNFMPLSRGTAASGLCVLHAMLLAVGVERRAPVPPGMQVDWEAILRPSPDDFVAALSGWRASDAPVSDAIAQLPPFNEVLPTLRHVLVAANATDANYFVMKA